MFWLRLIYSRLYGLLRKNRIEREMEEEIRFHLRMRAREKIERGMRPEEAEREARRRFGNVGHLKDLGRDIKGGGFMETLLQDVRYGARMLLKSPGFTLVAVITLALGIGATTTIFSLVNGYLLRQLPYPDSERLVLINEISAQRGPMGGISFANLLDWREQNQVFTGIAAWSNGSYTLTGDGDPEQIPGSSISYNAFEVLGVSPVLGRTFRPEEDRPEHGLVVILGHGLWERRFGAKPEIIGQTITINDRPRTVIGVMPPEFKFPEISELWLPLALDGFRVRRTDYSLACVARLKPGVMLAQAQADMNSVARRIEEQNPVTNKAMGVSLIQMRARLVVATTRKVVLILFGAVVLVLLIACANVANLLLARASARQREIAIRAALGAGRWRIFRQLLTESFLLGAIGGAFGLALASWGIDLVLAAIPNELPFWMKFNIDNRVLGFTVGISLLTALVCGTAPALQASRVDLNETLKEGGRGAAGVNHHRLRRLLVIAEVALSLILLIGAGLLMREFLRMQGINPGFKPENLLTMRIGLPGSKYDKPEKRSTFFQELIARIEALPGVQEAGATSHLPLRGTWWRNLWVEGIPVLSAGQTPTINLNVITQGYFKAMGIPILMGRDFTDADMSDRLKVTIIDERLAREYWPDQSPLGKRIRISPPENEKNEPWSMIVGVVGNVKNESLSLTQNKSVYLLHAQFPLGGMGLAVRATANPESLVGAIREQVKEMDPNLPVTQVLTMTEVVSRSIYRSRLFAILFGVFAGIALLLASVGIYGVMSYSVAQRTHEIGIRLALGARRSDVSRLIVVQGMKLTVVGTVIGLAGGLALTRLIRSLLYEVSTTDPLTFGLVAALLGIVALLACYIPARRATKVDPLVALRCE
jgi:predicted permease